MNKIKFLGASGTVTGSCYFLSNESGRGIIIDMGMYQGGQELQEKNYEHIDLNFSLVDAIILTHAHLDHCGRLPISYKSGFRGKIYMTKATNKLAELVLYDAANIARQEVANPLYFKDDVRELLLQMQIVHYNKEFKAGNYSVLFKDAGHLLGSASIIINDGQETIIFSGDLGNSPQNIQKPTELIDKGDIVVMESTYGDREHEGDSPMEVLQNEINIIERTGATLLIPAFSLERTQELMHRINHLKFEQKIKKGTPIFVDGPMAVKALRIYKQFKDLYNEELQDHARREDPFDFPGLHIIERNEESREIKDQYRGAKVIIAGSGMMSGGRIMRHAATFLPDPQTRLLIVGYQGEGTVGREIEQGAKQVMINDLQVNIKGTISKTGSMSTHAGQGQLVSWLKNIKGVKKVFLTHGDDEPRAVLKQKINDELGITDVNLPLTNQEFEI